MDFDPTPQQALAPTGAQPPASQPRQIAPNVQQTDFTDESVKKYEFELYSGKAGNNDRIMIPVPNAVVKGRTHFIERGAVKFSIVCRSQFVRSADGKREDLVDESLCCKYLGPSALRFAVPIVKYSTDRNGNVTRPFHMDLLLWKFGGDKYTQLRNIGRDFPLERHDLAVYCPPDGEQYQKLQIGAKPDCFLWHERFPEKERDPVLAWAKAAAPKLPRELGRMYNSDAELVEDLRKAGVLTPAGPAPAQPTDAPISNFDDIITTASAPTT